MQPKPKLYVIDRSSDVSLDTIRELEELLEEARTGRLTGVLVAGLYRGAAITCNVTGRCRTMPVISLGMAHLLLQDVEKLV